MHKQQMSPQKGDNSTHIQGNDWSMLNDEAESTVIHHPQQDLNHNSPATALDQCNLLSDLSRYRKSSSTIHRNYVTSSSTFGGSFTDYFSDSSPSLSLNSNARLSNSFASSSLTSLDLADSISFHNDKSGTSQYRSQALNRLPKRIFGRRFSAFSRQIMAFLRDYIAEESALNCKIESSLDRFKFEVIASNQMHSTAGAGTCCENVHCDDTAKTPFTTFTMDLNSIPYYPLVHSLKPVILSVGLFFYIVRNRRFISSENMKICILLCLYILSVNINTRRIAISVYLQMLTNRIGQFLTTSDSFDATVLWALHTHGVSKSKVRKGTLQRLYGVKKQLVRSPGATDFQLRNALSTVILSLNSKLVHILPLIDDYGQLSKYLQLYNANIDDRAGLFVKLLNRPSHFYQATSYSESSQLKPLRLHSLNCVDLLYGDIYAQKELLDSPLSPSSESSNSKHDLDAPLPDTKRDRLSGIWAAQSSPRQSMAFRFPRRSASVRSSLDNSANCANTEQKMENCSPNCLSGQPSKLMQQFRFLRRIYLCSLLCFVITSRHQLEDSADAVILFRASCISHFGLDESRFRHLSKVSRVFLSIKLLEQSRALLQCISDELRDNNPASLDEEDSDKENIGFGSLSGADNTILEEDEEDEHTERLSDLEVLLDSLSTKIGALKINIDASNQQRRLENLQDEFQQAMQKYSICCEDFAKPNMKQEISQNQFPEISDRHSRGLSISLLAVAKGGEDRRDDYEE